MKSLRRRISYAVLLSSVSLSLILSSNSQTFAATSNSDQALALAVTGCKVGLFTKDDQIAIGASTYSETILSTLWMKQENQTSVMKIHLNALAEGFSAAASLDTKYQSLATKYDQLYSYLESRLTSGKKYFELIDMGTSRYGSSIYSSCKVYLNQAKAKAKLRKSTLLAWVSFAGGNLLPELDVRG
jgi:hypothetical protein